ncbi:MAG: Gfo/Idh/MocA family oxidoreductase [Paenibacillus dendritiformis]|uniref:Gfo/Idh/MocA family protein n=1 Tax=Paenibacillus dendritiformis TaxID=130049 RepID=UPI00143D9AF7|nr:Gfo/Idh/MocA family oxidoreductase [Paenibacillus dendritiformis]MDU5141956.1 Gfo/Idh/MocA family oxidoreductase [Paenibacillus dendritiformis]NKI20088.1 Gfo/Idh/MocA family oxidoreductase [Paenibacillus dendritiformis]NRF98991.1 Gfo/Idh/MocA family oxidoreductase [Paenibacillus dendritiformis]GIO74796.1 oxidoreductase [Paenibacillus dendritiformis]
MSKVKVGVIGAGSISEMHFGGYQKNNEAELVAVCDLNADRAKEKAEKFGAPEAKIYTDYHELLANPDVEAVSICTWNNSHAEIAIAALEAGKHVLVEKPLCKTVEQALAVQEAQKKSGKTLQVGYVRRYGMNTRVLKKFIDAGDLGEIYYAKASCLRRLGNPGGWFSDVERSGGGPLIDLGVHVIDLCWYLMGKPKVKSVSGNAYNRLGNRNHIENLSFYQAADYDANVNTVEDMANALIRFENGASLAVDVSFALHLKQDEISVRLFGDKGGAEVEPQLLIMGEKHDTILNMTPQIDHLSFDFERGFQKEVDHFIDCCLGRTETICPVEDGVELMKILCAIYESSAKGTEIVFS